MHFLNAVMYEYDSFADLIKDFNMFQYDSLDLLELKMYFRADKK